jgi:hypothetical protein
MVDPTDHEPPGRIPGRESALPEARKQGDGPVHEEQAETNEDTSEKPTQRRREAPANSNVPVRRTISARTTIVTTPGNKTTARRCRKVLTKMPFLRYLRPNPSSLQQLFCACSSGVRPAC